MDRQGEDVGNLDSQLLLRRACLRQVPHCSLRPRMLLARKSPEDFGRQLKVGESLYGAADVHKAAGKVAVRGGRLDGVAAEGALPDTPGSRVRPRREAGISEVEGHTADARPEEGRVRMADRKCISERMCTGEELSRQVILVDCRVQGSHLAEEEEAHLGRKMRKVHILIATGKVEVSSWVVSPFETSVGTSLCYRPDWAEPGGIACSDSIGGSDCHLRLRRPLRRPQRLPRARPGRRRRHHPFYISPRSRRGQPSRDGSPKYPSPDQEPHGHVVLPKPPRGERRLNQCRHLLALLAGRRRERFVDERHPQHLALDGRSKAMCFGTPSV
mmetsp:Transcript_30096/g.65672  ORF Transcript_30096/g.65672 Transcript_30096/m.65672 type:complete len:329 (+) Transcript_30096:586-1572(+)